MTVKDFETGAITVIEGSELSIPVHVAGWDYTTAQQGTFPMGSYWDPENECSSNAKPGGNWGEIEAEKFIPSTNGDIRSLSENG